MLATIATMLMAASSAGTAVGSHATMEDVYTDLSRFNDSSLSRQISVDSNLDIRSAYAAGMVFGIFQGMMASVAYMKGDISCGTGVTSLTIARAMIAYIDAHPEVRTKDSWYETPAALTAIYPCINSFTLKK